MSEIDEKVAQVGFVAGIIEAARVWEEYGPEQFAEWVKVAPGMAMSGDLCVSILAVKVPNDLPEQNAPTTGETQ